MSFTAISPAHWWLLGSAPCGAEDCLAVVTTTNGGKTFQTLAAPQGSFQTEHRTTAVGRTIRFADATDGWVFDPGLYATHNGGHTWTAISVPGTVSALEPGLDDVYAVVAPPQPPCAKTGTCTSTTPAPGLWWARPSSNDWTVDPAAPAVSVGLAVHGRSIWVMNSMTTRDGPAIGTGLLHSTDGGGQFTLEPQPVPGIACTYSPVSNTVVWDYCSGGHFMSAHRSVDGGAYFTDVGPNSTSLITPNGYPNGASLEAATATVAVAACSVNSRTCPLIRTTDGGSMWSVVQPQPSTTGSWAVIGFTTPEVGYAFWESNLTAQLWRTSDGGATWSAVAGL